MKKLMKIFPSILWAYKPKGICPVQSEGYFMGHHFYFRARFDTIAIDFSRSYDDWWDDNVEYFKVLKITDGFYDAGYYPYNKCINLIRLGCFYFFIYKVFKIKL